jgi:hypothetical protein
MVKHGTQKKRRSGKKVTMKAPAHRTKKIISAITFSDIKKQYDSTKSPGENLAEFGLIADVNKMSDGPVLARDLRKGNQGSSHSKKSAAFIGYAHMVGNAEAYSEENPKRKKISEFDMEYAKANISKHGTNYKKMEMDLTTNSSQFTAKKMATLCAKYNEEMKMSE